MATLAELAYLSTSTIDFPIVEPATGFKRIKYPDSFKASLTQLCNEGYEAFALSHEAMDDVRLSTLSIPTDMKFVVKLLMKGSDYEVENNLPLALSAIEDAAETCSRRGQQVVDKYSSVLELIDELNETGQATKGDNERRAAELKLAKENDERLKQYQEELQKTTEKEVKEAKEQMEKREKEYTKALDSMPGPWGLLLMKVGETAVDALGTLTSFGLSQLTNQMPMPQGGAPQGQARPGQAPKQPETPKRLSVQTKMVYSTGLKNHVAQIEEGQRSLFAEDGGFAKDPEQVAAMKAIFNSAANTLACQGVDPALVAKVDPFYKAVQATMAKVSLNDDTNAPAVKQELEKHHMTALRFQAEASEILKSSLERATPEGVKASKAVGGGGGSMGEMAVKNAQAKIDTTQAMFENQAKRHKNACDDLLNTERILNETLNRLATTDATLASLDEILEMLKEVRVHKMICMLRSC